MKLVAIVVAVSTATLLVSAVTAADVVVSDTEVTKVTMYSQDHARRGEFERVVEVRSADLVDAGEYAVVTVGHLPTQLDENSVRVKQVVGARVLGTSFSDDSVNRADDTSYQEAVSSLEQEEDRLVSARSRHSFEVTRQQGILDMLKQYTSHLADVSVSAGGVSEEKSPQAQVPLRRLSIDDLAASINGVAALSAEPLKQQVAASADLRMTEKCLGDVQKRLDELRKFGRLVRSQPGCEVGGEAKTALGEEDKEVGEGSGPPENASRILREWPNIISHKSLHLHLRLEPGTCNEDAETIGRGCNTTSDAVKLLLTYQCRGVVWYPEYDVKLEKDSVEIHSFAAVSQSTGEDWRNVQLQLSTTSPSFQLDPPAVLREGVYFTPKPVPRRSDFGHAMPMRSKAAMGASSTLQARGLSMEDEADEDVAMFAESASGAAAAGAEPMMAFVGADGDLGQSYTFTVAHPVNISSGGTATAAQRAASRSAYRVLLNSERLDAQFFAYSAPRSKAQAYTTAVGRYAKPNDETNLNSAEGSAPRADTSPLAPILAASGRMFVDNAFVGSGHVPATMPGDSFRFNLGEDKNLKVTYETVLERSGNEEEDKSTFFTNDKRRFNVKTHEARLTATSIHSRPTLVVLEEAVPQTTHDDIRLLILEPHNATNISLSASKVDDGSVSMYSPSTGSVSEQLLGVVVDRMYALGVHGDDALHDASSDLFVFRADTGGSLFFAQWLSPGQKLTATLKYKVVWPEERSIHIR